MDVLAYYRAWHWFGNSEWGVVVCARPFILASVALTAAVRRRRGIVSWLGGVRAGNHYANIMEDGRGHIWVGVHLGSRGVGHKTAFGCPALAQGYAFEGESEAGGQSAVGRGAHAEQRQIRSHGVEANSNPLSSSWCAGARAKHYAKALWGRPIGWSRRLGAQRPCALDGRRPGG